VFDYGNPPALGPDQDEYAAARETIAARVAAVGEPFGSHFETNVLRAKLAALGFREVEDLNPALIRERYFNKPRGAPRLTEAATSYARRRCNRGKRISRSL
jgi:hypothetical protein